MSTTYHMNMTNVFGDVAWSYGTARLQGPRDWQGLHRVSILVKHGFANPATGTYAAAHFSLHLAPKVGVYFNSKERVAYADALHRYVKFLEPGLAAVLHERRIADFSTPDAVKERIRDINCLATYLAPFIAAQRELVAAMQIAEPKHLPTFIEEIGNECIAHAQQTRRRYTILHQAPLAPQTVAYVANMFSGVVVPLRSDDSLRYAITGMAQLSQRAFA